MPSIKKNSYSYRESNPGFSVVQPMTSHSADFIFRFTAVIATLNLGSVFTAW